MSAASDRAAQAMHFLPIPFVCPVQPQVAKGCRPAWEAGLPDTLSFWALQDESCLAGHLGERAPRTVDEDGSTIFGDATAADVGTEEVAEAESGSEASSKQFPAQQEHCVLCLVVFTILKQLTVLLGRLWSLRPAPRSQVTSGVNASDERGSDEMCVALIYT